MNNIRHIFLILTLAATSAQNIQAMKRQNPHEGDKEQTKRTRTSQQAPTHQQRQNAGSLGALPTDVLTNIILFSLDEGDLHSIMQTCKFLNQQASDTVLQKLKAELDQFKNQNNEEGIRRTCSKIVTLTHVLKQLNIKPTEPYTKMLDNVMKQFPVYFPPQDGSCPLETSLMLAPKILEHIFALIEPNGINPELIKTLVEICPTSKLFLSAFLKIIQQLSEDAITFLNSFQSYHQPTMNVIRQNPKTISFNHCLKQLSCSNQVHMKLINNEIQSNLKKETEIAFSDKYLILTCSGASILQRLIKRNYKPAFKTALKYAKKTCLFLDNLNEKDTSNSRIRIAVIQSSVMPSVRYIIEELIRKGYTSAFKTALKLIENNFYSIYEDLIFAPSFERDCDFLLRIKFDQEIFYDLSTESLNSLNGARWSKIHILTWLKLLVNQKYALQEAMEYILKEINNNPTKTWIVEVGINLWIDLLNQNFEPAIKKTKEFIKQIQITDGVNRSMKRLMQTYEKKQQSNNS